MSIQDVVHYTGYSTYNLPPSQRENSKRKMHFWFLIQKAQTSQKTLCVIVRTKAGNKETLEFRIPNSELFFDWIELKDLFESLLSLLYPLMIAHFHHF